MVHKKTLSKDITSTRFGAVSGMHRTLGPKACDMRELILDTIDR